MKPYLSLVLLAFCGSTLLLNCDCNKRTCTNPSPTAHFVNFDSSDLHAIIIKTYTTDGKFDQLQNTIIYSNTSEPGADTLQMTGNQIMIGYYFSDYTIEIPAVSKIWYLRNISSHYDKLNSSGCTSGMSWYLNDTLYTQPPNSLQPYLPGIITISK